MNSVTFSKSGPQLSENDISSAESKIGIHFPKEFKDLYLKANGGIPYPDCWPAQDDYEPIIISSFLSIDATPNGGGSVEETYQNGIRKGYLPKHLIPFAVDWGNNYICINTDGKVYFYATDSWHDEISHEDNVRKNERLLCESLSKFIDSLVEEDEAYE